MALPVNGDIWRYLFVYTGIDVGFAEVAAIGKQLGDGAELFWQCSQVFQGWFKFLLVVRLLCYMGSYYQL